MADRRTRTSFCCELSATRGAPLLNKKACTLKSRSVLVCSRCGFLRSSVLAGASAVHYVYQPDLTIPEFAPEEATTVVETPTKARFRRPRW
mgnify:CR=1 FL=1